MRSATGRRDLAHTETTMAVLFIGAGVTILGTFLMARWYSVQAQRFEAIAADPASRTLPRPERG